jgi:O-antigen/teichoic acid export membrane protein
MDEPASLVGMAAAPADITAALTVGPRRLATNLLYLSCGEIAARLLTFSSFTYLARTLDPASYGSVEFALAVMVFFSLPVDLGLSWYGAREIALNPGRARFLLREITGLRLILALCSMLALAVFILFLHKGADQKILLGLYGVSLLGGPFLLPWFFQAHDQMHWVAIASILRQACFAFAVFLLCRRGSPLLYIGISECFSVAAVSAFSTYVTRYRMGFPWSWPELRVTRLVAHLRSAAPIGFSELAWAFMWYFPTVLLGFTVANRTLGWFGASHRALMALHSFVPLYFFNLLPSIARCAGRPHEELLSLMDRSVRFLSWTGLFAAGLFTAAAPQTVTLLYGSSFRPAASFFAILIWMLPIAMLSGHHRFILIAYSHQKRLMSCTVISAGVAVILGFALIPPFQGQGAAWALLIANFVNFLLVYFSVRQLVVEVPVCRELGKPLFALAVSAVVFLLLAKWNIWIALTGGSAVYAAVLVWSDGPQLFAFVRTMANKPAAEAR